MMKRWFRPKWWLLYLVVAVIIGAYGLEMKRPYSAADHAWIEAGLIILLYVAVMAWISANEAGLLTIDRDNSKVKDAMHPVGALRSWIGERALNGNPPGSQKKHIWAAWLIGLLNVITTLFDFQDK